MQWVVLGVAVLLAAAGAWYVKGQGESVDTDSITAGNTNTGILSTSNQNISSTRQSFHGLQITIPEGFQFEKKTAEELRIGSVRMDPKTLASFFFSSQDSNAAITIIESEYTKVLSRGEQTINGLAWVYQINSTDLGIDDIRWGTAVEGGSMVFFFHDTRDRESYAAMLNNIVAE